jgi:hypothetical protein
MIEETMAEEEAWNAEQEVARIDAGQPPAPRVEKWSASVEGLWLSLPRPPHRRR